MDGMILDEALLVLGAIVIVCSLRMFHKTRSFIARCVTTTATVVGHRVEESDEGVDYIAVMRFVDADGRPHELEGSGARGVRQPPENGETISITYDPLMPSNAWPSGSPGAWMIPSLVFVIGVAAIASGIALRGGLKVEW